MGKSNLSPLCKRLEKGGYIQRVRNLKDERCVDIKMTEYAQGIMMEVTKKISESIIPTLSQIEDYKKNSIVEGLKFLNECLALGVNKD